jgi:hypothetical protein
MDNSMYRPRSVLLRMSQAANDDPDVPNELVENCMNDDERAGV